MSMLHQLDAERVQVEQDIRRLQAKRERIALDVIKTKVKPAEVDKIDAEVAKAQARLSLIASAREGAEAEAAADAEAASVERLKAHVAGALELADARVAAAAQLDRALNDLHMALATNAQLGAGCWARVVAADAQVAPGRAGEIVSSAHGFAFGSLGPLLAGICTLLQAEPRLRGSVEIHGVTTRPDTPSCQATAKEERQRLRAVLAVRCSPEAHRIARGTVPVVAMERNDMRVSRCYGDLQGAAA